MLKFIVVTFFVIMFIRLVAPFLIRFLIGFFLKKQMRKGGFMPPQYGQPHNPQQPQQPPRGYYKKPAGNLNVDYIPEDKTQKKDFPGGEYVDYEEVK